MNTSCGPKLWTFELSSNALNEPNSRVPSNTESTVVGQKIGFASPGEPCVQCIVKNQYHPARLNQMKSFCCPSSTNKHFC